MGAAAEVELSPTEPTPAAIEETQLSPADAFLPLPERRPSPPAGGGPAILRPSPVRQSPTPPAPTRPRPNLIGLTIGSYQILEKIGQGGMAEVYRAYHPGLNRYAAVKIMQPHLTDSGELVARFQREAQTVATLRHPNIVQIFDFGFLDVDASSYLIMEFIAGTSLQDEMIRRENAGEIWSGEEILRIFEQIAAALDYAHKRGVIHRDVKPGNILLNAEGDAILTDFGLSALRRGRSTMISTLGQPFGTPEYVAPEQAMDYKAAVTQSDQYSLGCILYELVTGHLPFEAETPLALALMHVIQDPFAPSYYVPDLPRPVEHVILKVLEKEPELRFQTNKAMVDALRRAWEQSAAPAQLSPAEKPVGDKSAHSASETAGPKRRGRPRGSLNQPKVTGTLSENQAQLILWAIENADSCLSRPVVCERLGFSTEYTARRLLEQWEERGWITPSANRKAGYQINDELIHLARERLGQGTVADSQQPAGEETGP